MPDEMSSVEEMLARFICADAQDMSLMELSKFGMSKNVNVGMEVDAGARFAFEPQFPTVAYTVDLSESRDIATDARLLLNTPQDIIGTRTEIALIDTNAIKWACFKKIFKRPRGIFVASNGADLYEYHSRFIYSDGRSDYRKRVAAISKDGRPIPVIIEGTRNNGVEPDGVALVMASSIIEDATRPDTFKVTVKDHVGVVFPVRQGLHLDIFKLRDGPAVGSRKKPLLHWVASHMRKNAHKQWDVKEHLRGVHEFRMDGFHVKLEAAA